jgi:hypothetical protein
MRVSLIRRRASAGEGPGPATACSAHISSGIASLPEIPALFKEKTARRAALKMPDGETVCVQRVGERRERGGEEERDPDEPRPSERAIQAQDAPILDDRRRAVPARKLEYASSTVSVWGI